MLLLQSCTAVILKLVNEFQIVSARFTTIATATSYNLEIEVLFFDRCDRLDMKLCFMDEHCLITVYATALVPIRLASPNNEGLFLKVSH